MILVPLTVSLLTLANPAIKDSPQEASADLAAPILIHADGKPIDVDIGHAAPFVVDFDRDGLKDLLVGQFGAGKLRIYKNTGTNAEPKFGEPTWFLAGGTLGVVPSG